MEHLLLATTNPAKAREFRSLFQLLGLPIELRLPPSSWHCEEKGDSFKEIAIQKARSAAEEFGEPALADDGGLEIDALGGKPGILSRRWPGYSASDEELLQFTLEKMKDIPEDKRGAQFKTAVAFADTNESVWTAEGVLRGRLALTLHPKREKGYPYRSLFVLLELERYAIEASDDELLALGHRRAAMEELIKQAPFFRNLRSSHVLAS